jgi:hypothetical protein
MSTLVEIFSPKLGMPKQYPFTEVRELLNNRGNILKVELINASTEGSIDFSLGFHDVFLNGVNLSEAMKYHPLPGCFPGTLYGCDFVGKDLLNEAFEKYLFGALEYFLFGYLHAEFQDRVANMRLYADGLVNWDNVVEFMNLHTCNLPWFTQGVTKDWRNKDSFAYILTMKPALTSKFGFFLPKKSPLVVFNGNKEKVRRSLEDVACTEGDVGAEIRIRKTILRGIAYALYSY